MCRTLFQLGETCRRLSSVTSDPNLWKVVDLSSVKSSASQLRARLKHVGVKTTSIKIKGFYTSYRNQRYYKLPRPPGLTDQEQIRQAHSNISMVLLLQTSSLSLHIWKSPFSKNSVAIVIVIFLAEMGRIPCCGRPESSSSNI